MRRDTQCDGLLPLSNDSSGLYARRGQWLLPRASCPMGPGGQAPSGPGVRPWGPGACPNALPRLTQVAVGHPGGRVRVGDQSHLGLAGQQRMAGHHPHGVPERAGPAQPASPAYGRCRRRAARVSDSGLVSGSTISSSSPTRPQTASTRDVAGRQLAQRHARPDRQPVPGPRSPSPASMCSMCTPAQAARTRRFQAASSRAAAKSPVPGGSPASAREARAAGTYSSVTYSRTIRDACARGPRSAKRVRDHLQPPAGQPAGAGVVEQRRHRPAPAGRTARRTPARRGGRGRLRRRPRGSPSRSRRRTTRPTSRRGPTGSAPPFSADFMPEVPHASRGRSGLFSHTSHPWTMAAASAMS